MARVHLYALRLKEGNDEIEEPVVIVDMLIGPSCTCRHVYID